MTLKQNSGESLIFNISLGVVFVLILLFIILPFFQITYWSFTDKNIGESGRFIGFDNYVSVICNPESRDVFLQTVVYTLFSVLFKLIIGVFLAAFVAQKLIIFFSANRSRTKHQYRLLNLLLPLFLISWAMPTSANVMIWRWILSDFGGPLNFFVKEAGISDQNVGWLSSYNLATGSLIVVNVWRGIGYFLVSLFSAISLIPDQRYKIARLEGASNFKLFTKITLPIIKPTTIIITMISLINTYTDFQLVHLLTNGGPGDLTHIFSTKLYEYGILNERTFGYASAFSIIFLIPLSILILWGLRKIRNEEVQIF